MIVLGTDYADFTASESISTSFRAESRNLGIKYMTKRDPSTSVGMTWKKNARDDVEKCAANKKSVVICRICVICVP